MKNYLSVVKMKYFIILIGMSFLHVCVNPYLCAQQSDWKTKTTKDGSVTVSYDFSEFVNEDGKKFQRLEYEAKRTAAVTLENCVKVMKNDSNHKAFMEGVEDTHRIKEISEDEWVTYYFMNARWPMPNADVVTHYLLEEEPGKNRIILTGTPAPDLYPDQGVGRMKHNHTKYTFTDLGNGNVEIVMYSSSIPLVSVPRWLISTWIPNGPADMLNGIAELAE